MSDATDATDPAPGTSSHRAGAVGLDELAPGQGGRVVAIDAVPPLATRLADLGFCPGTPVATVRKAPLGDPVLYELRGYQIALRRQEARLIQIVPEPGPRS